MLSTHAWCNPNRILPHYPQNCKMIQQALLPVNLREPKHRGRPQQDLERFQLILAIAFMLEKKNCTTSLLNSL